MEELVEMGDKRKIVRESYYQNFIFSLFSPGTIVTRKQSTEIYKLKPLSLFFFAGKMTKICRLLLTELQTLLVFYQISHQRPLYVPRSNPGYHVPCFPSLLQSMRVSFFPCFLDLHSLEDQQHLVECPQSVLVWYFSHDQTWVDYLLGKKLRDMVFFTSHDIKKYISMRFADDVNFKLDDFIQSSRLCLSGFSTGKLLLLSLFCSFGRQMTFGSLAHPRGLRGI